MKMTSNPTHRTACGHDRVGFAVKLAGIQYALPTGRLRGFFHQMMEVVSLMSLENDGVGCTFLDRNRKQRSVSAKRKTWRKRIGEREDWTGLNSIVIGGRLPEGAHGVVTDLELIYQRYDGKHGLTVGKYGEAGDHILIGVERHPDVSPDQVEHLVLHAIRSLSNAFRIEAGFGFWRPNLQMAICNADGVNFDGLPNEREVHEASHKYIFPHAMYSAGYLPCVTRWNVLCPPQFQSRIDDAPLIDWINGNPERGRIESVGRNALDEKMLLWIVDADKCLDIEQALIHAGLILTGEELTSIWSTRGFRPYSVWQENYVARYARLVDDVVEPLIKSGEYDAHFVLVRRPLSDLVDGETGREATDDERVCDIIIAGQDRKLYLIEVAFPNVLPQTVERKLRSMMRNIPEHRRGGWRVIDYEEAKAIAGWPPGEPPVDDA